MMQDMWKLFPRLIEQKINGLLEEAHPNRTKAFHLYKCCHNENLWTQSFENFSTHLQEFFSLPKAERTKSKFDFYLNRPMHKRTYDDFQLDFRNAIVESESLHNVSSWTYNIMRLNCNSSCQIISLDVIRKTLKAIVNPGPFDKAQDIEFDDFCGTWKRIVTNMFGHKYDSEVGKILDELNLLNHEQKQLEKCQRSLPKIYLTQTEIDWTESVLLAAQDFSRLPKYPLSKGPQKDLLIDIARVAQLYCVVMESKRQEVIEHRQNVRQTLIYRCEELLKKRQH